MTKNYIIFIDPNFIYNKHYYIELFIYFLKGYSNGFHVFNPLILLIKILSI